MKNENLREQAWDESYLRKENYVFYPCDEVVRFVSKFLRKRVGIDTVVDVVPGAAGSKVLDLGAGLGRNLIFGESMGLKMFGVELSGVAVEGSKNWAKKACEPTAAERFLQGSIEKLPWSNDFFDHALSDSVLDSMPFSVACEGVKDLARVLKKGGLFYFNVISGEETAPSGTRNFSGEEVVSSLHEQDTIQSYFDKAKIEKMLDGKFSLLQCSLHRVEDKLSGHSRGRWHVVAKKI